MKNMTKRLVAVALLLCMLAAVFTPVSASASTSNTAGKRYNIMLVIDGSGSLTSKNAGYTDPRGMRYALIGELMGILEDDGHNIGGIVFSGTQSKKPNPTDAEMEEGIMLNTGLLSLDSLSPDGRTPKDYLEAEVRRVYVDTSKNGSTDIGTALMIAQEQLQQMKAKNGLESVVFLFTDGNTAFYNNPAGVIKKSVENRDNATLQMSQNGIRLFGAFLNNGGKLDDSEMKRLVCAANGISTTSPEFQYSYVEIEDASSIHDASTSFLKFLGYIDPNFIPNVSYNDIHDTFTVPGIGVEEMNIRLYSPYGDDLPALNVKITQPDGTVITGVPMKESRTFRVYKLIKPDPGLWQIDITVPAGNALAYVYTPVVSLYIDSLVESNPAPQNLFVNQSPDFTCLLSQAGTAITDPAAYYGYDCALQIKDVSNGNTVSYDVLANTAGAFTQNVLLGTYGTFEVKTIFSCGEIVVPSSPITLDLTNRTPTGSWIPPQDLKYGLFQPKTTDLDLTQYVSDPEDGTNLAFSVNSATCDLSAITLQGGTLTMNNKGIGDSSITITATDSQGASATVTVNTKTTGVTIWYIIGLIVLLIIIAIIVFVSIRAKNSNLPDGNLSVSFDMLHEGKARKVSLDLSIPGVNTTSKTSLYKLLQDVLRNEDRQIASGSGIYARDVMAYLIPFSAGLSGITVFAAIKKQGKKKVGAIGVKQGKKSSVLYDSFADFFLSDASFTIEFKADPKDGPDPFGSPFDGVPTGKGKGKPNPFDGMDDIFQTPVKDAPRKSSHTAKKDSFGGADGMDDFFQAPPKTAPKKPSRPAKKEPTGSTNSDSIDFF